MTITEYERRQIDRINEQLAEIEAEKARESQAQAELAQVKQKILEKDLAEQARIDALRKLRPVERKAWDRFVTDYGKAIDSLHAYLAVGRKIRAQRGMLLGVFPPIGPLRTQYPTDRILSNIDTWLKKHAHMNFNKIHE